MNIKTLIMSLVLGTSSLAMAQPVSFGASAGVTVSANLPARGIVDIRDHRHPEPGVVMQPVQVDNCANIYQGNEVSTYTGPVGAEIPGSWSALTQPTKIGRGGEQVDLGWDKGRFHELKLVADSGSTFVTKVIVQFGNGEYQTVALDRTLDASHPQTLVRLNNATNGRGIQRIVVEGSSGFGARYSILAA